MAGLRWRVRYYTRDVRNSLYGHEQEVKPVGTPFNPHGDVYAGGRFRKANYRRGSLFPRRLLRNFDRKRNSYPLSLGRGPG